MKVRVLVRRKERLSEPPKVPTYDIKTVDVSGDCICAREGMCYSIKGEPCHLHLKVRQTVLNSAGCLFLGLTLLGPVSLALAASGGSAFPLIIVFGVGLGCLIVQEVFH